MDLLARLWTSLGAAADNLVYLSLADSTHAAAGRLIDEVDDEEATLGPTVLVAGRQSAGRGRGDHTWSSPEGGLYLTWLSTGVPSARAMHLPMVAAAAVWQALAAVSLEGHGVKWPNDILHGGRKLAGLLVTARHGAPHWVTVSLGVNLASAPDLGPSAAYPAGSITDILGPREWTEWAEPIITTFVAELARGIAEPAPALQQWREALVHQLGDSVAVRLASGETVRGRYRGVTADGFLRLASDGAERIISTGDVFPALDAPTSGPGGTEEA